MNECSTDCVDAFLARLEKKIPNISAGGLLCFRLFHHITPRLRLFLEQSLKDYNLSETQWFALLSIYAAEQGEILPSELSLILDLTPTSATRLSDNLLENGWITRESDQDDRRKIVLRLTNEGEQLIQKVAPNLKQRRLQFSSIFSEEEISQLESLLRRLNDELELYISGKK